MHVVIFYFLSVPLESPQSSQQSEPIHTSHNSRRVMHDTVELDTIVQPDNWHAVKLHSSFDGELDKRPMIPSE
jgi:hypothetical protein